MPLVGLSSGGGVLEVRGKGFGGFVHDGASNRESGCGSSTISVIQEETGILIRCILEGIEDVQYDLHIPIGDLHYTSLTIYAYIGCGK
jgi:hypothetical protein